ncbi:hypothetical protein WJX72_005789 [[Myrmecia] bisecta]|uniref:Ubiquitin-like protease family profile domain-containing protein n=1 Tax=[Myrmecia] bisecta TaxID=41462 RepID=A0AAW1PAA7_9CHLO
MCGQEEPAKRSSLKRSSSRSPASAKPARPLRPITARPSSLRHAGGNQWTAKVQQVWRSRGKDDVVVVDGPANLQVTYKNLRTLRGSGWLDDEVVNLYLRLVQEHNERLRGLGYHGIPDVAILSSFFWTRVTYTAAKYDYPGVQRWTRRNPVLHKDLLLIPINHSNVHWCLACIDLKAGVISYYDSMAGNGLSGHGEAHVLPTLLRWLRDEMADKKHPLPIGQWQLRVVRKGVPQQRDSCSCGVFACVYAERLAFGQAFTFSQADMPALRLGLGADICALQVEARAST